MGLVVFLLFMKHLLTSNLVWGATWETYSWLVTWIINDHSQ